MIYDRLTEMVNHRVISTAKLEGRKVVDTYAALAGLWIDSLFCSKCAPEDTVKLIQPESMVNCLRCSACGDLFTRSYAP